MKPYIPKHFRCYDIFPQEVVNYYTTGRYLLREEIWHLIDDRLLWTMDALYEYYGRITINDYITGGRNKYRGFIPQIDIVNLPHYLRTLEIKAVFSTPFSQHTLGRAMDFATPTEDASEAAEDIQKNKTANRYKFVKAFAAGPGYVHIDLRSTPGEDICFFQL